MSIAQNLARVRERISGAATRAGRDPGSVKLMAVSKTFGVDAIREAYAAGQRLFGENRVQEFSTKAGDVRELAGFEMHLIGHLQSNKGRRAVELFDAVDSLDSVKLADRLNAAAGELGKTLPVLIEINIGGEDAKSGLAVDSPELEALLAAASRWPNLRINGMMTVPPYTEDPEGARPYFRRLRELRDKIAARNLPGVAMNELSIGMSRDFEKAIEEGSTCVRVGTAIFGARDYA
jgi:pyridoxal phosphate enzyme (YggS family)